MNVALDFTFHLYTCLKYKLETNQKLKCKWFLKEHQKYNIGKHFHELEKDYDFLTRTSTERTKGEKTGKLGYINIKDFYSWKDYIMRIKLEIR